MRPQFLPESPEEWHRSFALDDCIRLRDGSLLVYEADQAPLLYAL